MQQKYIKIFYIFNRAIPPKEGTKQQQKKTQIQKHTKQKQKINPPRAQNYFGNLPSYFI